MKSFKLDAEINSFDYDGEWGKIIGPRSVAAWLKNLRDGETAEIEINSPGGSVIAGLAIANSIKNSKARIRAHVIGIAASMASVVACACDELVMEEGAFLMIHNPWTDIAGDANELRHQADILDSMKDALIGFYRSKFGGTPEQLSAMMDGETWMTGREAQSNGFLCEVVASDAKIAAAVTPHIWDKAPEAAKAFCRESALTDDLRAAIKAAAETMEETAETSQDPTPVDVPDAPAVSLDEVMRRAGMWEARYKGACKAINERDELKAKLEILAKDLADEQSQRADAVAKIEDLNGQLANATKDLDAARAECSTLLARAESAEKDLARSGEQLDRLTKAHALLTGGVLSPATEESPVDAKKRELANAHSPEERERIREKYRRTK